MNFGELKSELFARGTDYLDEDSDGVARAARWLNQAYREILNLQAWPFLQAVATGDADAGFVEVPDLRRIRFVLDANTESKLQRISLDDLVEQDTEFSRSGDPYFYYVDGGTTVKTYPSGGTIQVYYIKRGSAMTADADEPLFRDEYHNLIVDRAMMKAYVDSDNFEAAAALRQEFDAGAASMAEDYQLDSREVQFIDVNPYDG